MVCSRRGNGLRHLPDHGRKRATRTAVSYTHLVFRYERASIASSRLPHSDIPGSSLACSCPRLFAACRVLLRLLAPRHSPYALTSVSYTHLDVYKRQQETLYLFPVRSQISGIKSTPDLLKLVKSSVRKSLTHNIHQITMLFLSAIFLISSVVTIVFTQNSLPLILPSCLY